VIVNDVELAGRPRWRGKPGRLEVHYLTATDRSTGTGLWLHHEVVAPTTGDAYAHGWVTVFPTDAAPRCERFGPSPVVDLDRRWLATADGVVMTPTSASGTAGGLDWDVRWDPASSAPLWTFPRWAWRRQLLPAAQVLPTPTTTVTGSVGSTAYDGPSGIAHIYGHGNAQRWVWLHADLGAGDVLEIVAATARRPGMRALPPLPLLQLRVGGVDWPRDPLAAAPLLRARIDRRDAFRVSGIVGRRRIDVQVLLPADRRIELGYVDPDGATATCTNTELADVHVRTERLRAGRWRNDREWFLTGTAHAEIGTRP